MQITKVSPSVNRLVFQLPTKRWILVEITYLCLLSYLFLIRRIQRDADVINFHIAYPQLTFWHYLKFLVRKGCVISEHWSAYHYNFGVNKKLRRIQRIYRNGLPLITVSRSLLLDIEKFSAQSNIESFVIPNVVDSSVFYFKNRLLYNRGVFLMVSQWQWPKRPDLVITAFHDLIQLREYGHCELRIAGYGVQMESMRTLVNSLCIQDKVIFLGPLQPAEVALEMNSCDTLLHPSEYETFSVVCAEALCCGVPVIASKVGGIQEYLNDENGILVKSGTEEGWLTAFKEFDSRNFDRAWISRVARQKFGKDEVGLRYFNCLKSISASRGRVH